ncbi:hypothetical protein CYMTET_36397 [Cymbomonas tetramitiformis]|uniref:Uncharacterized protein n=1 Tax=Cymbomonas tetramitiformis TaxID=36881 RepID=A0AAE0CG07_9CHLO|nr:hypothetical protein CYMTET_36397 [Cymbomonas tetramitiformis]
MFLVLFLLVLMVWLLWYGLVQVSRAHLMRAKFMGKAAEQKNQHNAVLMGILFGYLQVISPTFELFYDLLPEEGMFKELIVPISVFNLPLAWMMQFQCIVHNVGLSSDTSNPVPMFYIEMIMKAAMPLLVVLGFGGEFLRQHLMMIRGRTRFYASSESVRGSIRASTLRRSTIARTVTGTWYHDFKYNISTKKGACVAAISFLLVFLYPTVGLQMFRIFHCDEVLHEEAPGTVEYWLRNDRAVKCFEGGWYLPATFATLTIVTYIFGFPAMVAYILYRLNNAKLYELTILSDSNDQKTQTLPQAWMIKAKQTVCRRRRRRHSHPLPTTESFPAMDPVPTKMHRAYLESEERGAGSRAGQDSEGAQEDPGLKERKVAEEEEEAEEVADIIFQDEEDDDEDEIIVRGKRIERRVYAQDSEVYHEANGQLWLVVNGQRMAVRPVMRCFETRRGAQCLQITRLQDKRYLFYWGRFYIGLEPNLYFFNCIALLRRLTQTGFVVVVQIVEPRSGPPLRPL